MLFPSMILKLSEVAIRKDLHETNILYSPTKDVNLRLYKYLQEEKHQLVSRSFSSPEPLENLKTKLKYSAAALRAISNRGCPLPSESSI